MPVLHKGLQQIQLPGDGLFKIVRLELVVGSNLRGDTFDLFQLVFKVLNQDIGVSLLRFPVGDESGIVVHGTKRDTTYDNNADEKHAKWIFYRPCNVWLFHKIIFPFFSPPSIKMKKTRIAASGYPIS